MYGYRIDCCHSVWIPLFDISRRGVERRQQTHHGFQQRCLHTSDLAKLDGGQQTKVVAEQRRKGRLAIGKDLLDEHCADISSDRKTGGLAGGAALQGLQNQCRKFAIGLLKEDITDEKSKIDSTLVDDISWDGTLLDLWDEYAELLDKKNNAVYTLGEYIFRPLFFSVFGFPCDTTINRQVSSEQKERVRERCIRENILHFKFCA